MAFPSSWFVDPRSERNTSHVVLYGYVYFLVVINANKTATMNTNERYILKQVIYTPQGKLWVLLNKSGNQNCPAKTCWLSVQPFSFCQLAHSGDGARQTASTYV